MTTGTVQTQASLDAEIEAQLPSTNRNKITAALLRPVLHDMVASLGVLNPARSSYSLAGINFNSTNTDNAIAVTLPAGAIAYRVAGLRIGNASASISTATFGLFSAAAAAGTAIFAAGQAITVTTASANTNNNAMTVTPANQNTQFYNFTTLFFRVGTAQGSAATADVTIDIDFLY
jgi:hypothetical protein